MTVFNIYCDESLHTSDKGDRYAVIGALQCPRDEKSAGSSNTSFYENLNPTLTRAPSSPSLAITL